MDREAMASSRDSVAPATVKPAVDRSAKDRLRTSSTNEDHKLPVWQRTWFLAFAGAVLLWMAFPPLDLWPLAYVAVVPWVLLMRQPKLSGRRPYLLIYAAGLLHWLLLLQGIRLAHWALYFGWFALSAFIACYLPVTIAVARVMVHRLRVPVVFAAPVAWVGIELIRGYLASGFSLALLGHTQANWTTLLQVADFGGAYVVSFVVMAVAAGLACLVPLASSRTTARRSLLSLGFAGLTLAAAIGYGQFRDFNDSFGRAFHKDTTDPVRVALVQGSLDTVFEITPERVQQTLDQYYDLTKEVRKREPELDLVVWPESMFMIHNFEVQEPLQRQPGSDATPEHLRSLLQARRESFDGATAALAAAVQGNAEDRGRSRSGTSVVVGTSTIRFAPDGTRQFNTALLLDPQGKVASRYDKMHAVMCGEYLPLGDLLPWIYGLTPMGAGMSVGDRPEVFEVGGQKFSPSICFESTVPHLIRNQVNELARTDGEPDVLLNVTNDGWFWGSAILDLHLRCSVFRAVENRKPMVIAANTGFSAWIDGNGKVLKQGPRRATTTLVAEVLPDGRMSPYRRVGDLFAGLCAAACWVAAVIGVWTRRGPAGESASSE
jgi:apolipoprotein N-acyltransferase